MANGAVIGGTTDGSGNLISGASTNGAYGVWLTESVNVTVRGNLIGTASDGMTPLPNGSHGVYVNSTASNNIIGGLLPEFANTIAFNGGDGVQVDAQSPQVRSNTISENPIYGNTDKGIALINAANDNIQPPVVSAVDPAVMGTSCPLCRVELFSDAEDEGRVYEGEVLADNNGDWTFAGPLSGPNVTTTATDNSNNTSEFSAPFPLPGTHKQGDADCDGDVDLDDVVALLSGIAGGGFGDRCNSVAVLGAGNDTRDVDCDGSITPVDALDVLLDFAGLPEVSKAGDCPAGGEPLG